MADGPDAAAPCWVLVALLPVLGVDGAAIASAVAYGVALAVMLLALRRLRPDSSGPRHRKRPASQDPSQGV